jgi:hypothetical protein
LSQPGNREHRLTPGPTCGSFECVEDSSYRMFLRARCRCQLLVCRRFDRGQIYCFGTCAQETRRDRQREARLRYQATPRGHALHAKRNRRYRARQIHRVTNHGPTSASEARRSLGLALDAALSEPPSHGKSSGHARCHRCDWPASAFLRQSALRSANRRNGRPHDRGGADLVVHPDTAPSPFCRCACAPATSDRLSLLRDAWLNPPPAISQHSQSDAFSFPLSIGSWGGKRHAGPISLRRLVASSGIQPTQLKAQGRRCSSSPEAAERGAAGRALRAAAALGPCWSWVTSSPSLPPLTRENGRANDSCGMRSPSVKRPPQGLPDAEQEMPPRGRTCARRACARCGTAGIAVEDHGSVGGSHVSPVLFRTARCISDVENASRSEAWEITLPPRREAAFWRRTPRRRGCHSPGARQHQRWQTPLPPWR